MERPFFRTLLLGLLASLFMPGCSDDTAVNIIHCTSDSDCPEGTGCNDGVCYSQCVTSADCKGSDVCISGFCLTPCESDDDCEKGKHCERQYCKPDEVQDAGDGFDGNNGDDCVDEDQDGFGNNCARGPDCDDTDRLVNPAIPEKCNDGVDNDCDGDTDEGDCGCKLGDRWECYDGPFETLGVGNCRLGVATCNENNEYGPCQGQVMPKEEICNQQDDDCDGETDEGLLNRCGQCSPPDDQLVEICGNGLDDDCDGLMDEDCSCDPNCHCDDPGSGSNCQCHPPVDQPCYSGPPNTLGFGVCKGGTHDCAPDGAGGWAWTTCEGEVKPSVECLAGMANNLDDDCDGITDENCMPDGDGDGYAPPEDCDDSDKSVNPGASETCNSKDDNCNGLVDEGVTNACGTCGDVPQEICGNGLDDNCDGSVDEGCGGCSGNETRQCYRGPVGTQGVGQCAFGTQQCDGEFWGACQGDVLPDPEICDGKDNDCDGETDEQWAVGSNSCGFCESVETCDGQDNDCDGFTDEGLRNSCGQCLPVPDESNCNNMDDDCDGLTDEGLLTACGTCPDVPCYEQDWDTPGDCDADLRDCDGTVSDPSDPDAVTLGQGTVRTPFIYISVTGRDQVAKLDTETGQKLWQVSSHGDYPSRTAVALDYSVWVGNRGFGSPSDPDYSNGVHLDTDGNLLCRVDAVNVCRAVAIDGDGNVWFGTFSGMTLYKVHGADTNNTDCSRPPCCRVLGTVNVGVSIYGLAVDGNGYLWTASSPETVKVDTATMSVAERVSNPSFYGIAIDQNNDVWLGGWSGGSVVHKINSNAPHTIFNTQVNNVTGVTVAPDGYIWGSRYGSNQVVKIDPNTGAAVCTGASVNGTNPHGVAVDANGKIWVPNRYGGYANRYNQDCSLDGSFPVDPGQELYTYSDMTGMQLRTITTREGHWIQNFDSGYSNPIWHSATWEASVPAATSVSVTFVSADTEAELVTNHSPSCGPFNASPADLFSCPQLQGHRWLSADVKLDTTQDGVRPSFSALRVFWSY